MGSLAPLRQSPTYEKEPSGNYYFPRGSFLSVSLPN